MLGHGITLAFTVLMWWLATGSLMLVCALPRATFAWTLMVGSFGLVVAGYGLVHSAWSTSGTAPYVAFLSAIGVWGWLEMTFLMGFVTGPRRLPCPPEASGWRRFRLAVATLLYHELAIVAGAAIVVALTWGAPNQTGTDSFLILMVMRISAKLNIFLGVPSLADQFLPKHLDYLKSYFCKRSFNWLFPVSMAGAVLVAALLARRALTADGADGVGAALLFTLITLAIVEHLFMIVPWSDAPLWQWAVSINGSKPARGPSP
jgi:putative photosynthetic complex assembly protein 2